jgi:nitroreductase
MSSEPGIFEVIHSLRAMRRLKPDPVPDELVHEILRAGTSAPSAVDRQPWRFLVVKDAGVKAAVQQYYKRALGGVAGPPAGSAEEPAGPDADKARRRHAAVVHLTEHFHEAPVWIVACLDEREQIREGATGSHGALERSKGASIYPAVQNMLLAARALGLGCTLTTRHLVFAAEVDALFGLPPGVESYAILPLGYPMGRFGPVNRIPLRDVVYLDRWGDRDPTLG